MIKTILYKFKKRNLQKLKKKLAAVNRNNVNIIFDIIGKLDTNTLESRNTVMRQ